MAQVDIPDFQTYRRRTRTYDKPSENTKSVIDAVAALLVPVGTFIPTALENEPAGDVWKLCNGQALNKADFPSLYAVFGNKFGETATTFNLPDMQGRTVMGIGPSLTLGALTGLSQVTLTTDQLPSHAHTVTDPGHTHTFTGSPHSHTVTDPGHTHTVDEAGTTADSATGTDQVTAQPGGTSGSATTGVSVDDAIAAGSNSSEITGITIDPAGGGQPVDITPPVIGVNWLVRT